jgi:hypothetical protein
MFIDGIHAKSMNTGVILDQSANARFADIVPMLPVCPDLCAVTELSPEPEQRVGVRRCSAKPAQHGIHGAHKRVPFRDARERASIRRSST